MAAANYCCVSEQQRSDSPEPPARPLAAIDGIFAAAVLPEDHPHALKFPERKAETDATIVQSPTLTSKIKLQFQKRSVKNLKKPKEYDVDARQLSLQEVLDEFGCPRYSPQGEAAVVQNHRRLGSIFELDKLDKPGPDLPKTTKPVTAEAETTRPEVRSSVLKTLGYLQPLLQKSSESTADGNASNQQELGLGSKQFPRVTDSSHLSVRSGQAFPKSLSSPFLPLDEKKVDGFQRRSCSDSNLREPVFNPPCSINDLAARNFATSEAISDATRGLHIQDVTEIKETDDPDPYVGDESDENPREDEVPHLHKMDISEQLRSMSQMSEVVQEPHLSHNQPWTFHYRDRSHLGASAGHSRHVRQTSSSGLDSTSVPSAWGKVRVPIRDTASSIYSRPVSTDANEQDVQRQDSPTYDNLNDLHALFADWPLKPLTSSVTIQRGSRASSGKRTKDEINEKPLPPTPADSRKDSGTTSFVTAVDDEEASSRRFLSLQKRDISIPSKRSSSTFTKASKQSKFLERFSPPKKAVRKRLSVFKFLRPGSRKRQIRSISSPILHIDSASQAGVYDGQSEDPALLTVQYELTDQPNHVTRSASMGLLGARSQGIGGHLAPQHMLQRQPTLADYERNLSAAGDDRRRPSAINVQRVKEIQEDDHRESLALKRKLSRARPLKDDVSPLMAQALEKHQQEKALFRSASKRRESSKDTHNGSTASSSPYIRIGSSLPPPSVTDYNDLLDPLEKGYLASPSEPRVESGHLLPPGSHISASSQRTSPAGSIRGPSTRTSLAGPVWDRPPQSKKRIGTSLDSWSRYPSHTRADRCGSAGRPDAVLARDFAIDINPDEIHGSEDTQIESPEKVNIAKCRSQRSKTSLPKSRSMMFSGIVRYYSNLFHTKDWYGQNRRTSVTTGGRLEYPELEMLPPPTSSESAGSHKHSEHLKHLEERIMEDASKVKHYFQEEESKLEGYVRKEEKAIEGFVADEERRLSDFVRKEEEKLKEFVIEEEDKFKHRHHHDSSSRSSSRKRSPYLTGAVFKAPSYKSEDHMKRSDTSIAPNDDVEKKQVHHSSPEARFAFDGSALDEVPKYNMATSKAEIWSSLYKECLIRPLSRAVQDIDQAHGASTAYSDDAQSMPPPILKPVKPRTPDKPKPLDPQATIRRFPSVTVIDDRKGHGRSISLLSVKTRRSTGFERTSTHDLFELIQTREREEREKLLKAINGKDQAEFDRPS